MKYIIMILFCAVLMSCSKEGEISSRSTKALEINGKRYHFISVVPADGAYAVWLLIPEDATVEVPQSTSYVVSCGKNCHRMQTLIRL